MSRDDLHIFTLDVQPGTRAAGGMNTITLHLDISDSAATHISGYTTAYLLLPGLAPQTGQCDSSTFHRRPRRSIFRRRQSIPMGTVIGIATRTTPRSRHIMRRGVHGWRWEAVLDMGIGRGSTTSRQTHRTGRGSEARSSSRAIRPIDQWTPAHVTCRDVTLAVKRSVRLVYQGSMRLRIGDLGSGAESKKDGEGRRSEEAEDLALCGFT
jgi:hypothetical protein